MTSDDERRKFEQCRHCGGVLAKQCTCFVRYMGEGRAKLESEVVGELVDVLRGILNGDYAQASKNGKCQHGTFSWDTCEACLDEYVLKALAKHESLRG